MRKRELAALTLFFASYLPFASAAEDGVARAIDFLKTACASGEKIDIKIDGDGALNLIGRSAKGGLHFSKAEARGIAEGLSSGAQRTNLVSVRECMQPHISRILDALLPTAQTPEGPKPKK